MAFNNSIGTMFVDIDVRGMQGFRNTVNSIKSTTGTLNGAQSAGRFLPGGGVGGVGGFASGAMGGVYAANLAGRMGVPGGYLAAGVGGAALRGGLGIGLGAAAAAGGVAATAWSAKSAADMDASRRQLNSILRNPDQFQSVSKGLDELATKIPIPTAALYEMAKAAAQVGVQGSSNILKFTEEVAKFVTISKDMDPATAMEKFARIQKVFPEASVEKLSNLITKVSDESAADPGTLLTSIERLAGSSKNIGLVAEQVTALAGALRDLPGGAEVATTGMSLFMNAMSRKPEAFGKLNQMSSDQFKSLRDSNPFEAFSRSMDALRGQSKDERLSSLKDLGFRGNANLNPILGMIEALPNLTRLAAVAAEESKKLTATNERFGVIAEGTWKKVQILGNELQLLGSTVGEKFAPMVNAAVDAMTRFVAMTKEWIDTVSGAPDKGDIARNQAIEAVGAANAKIEEVRKAGENITVEQVKAAQASLDAVIKAYEKAIEQGKPGAVPELWTKMQAAKNQLEQLDPFAKKAEENAAADRELKKAAEEAAEALKGVAGEIRKLDLARELLINPQRAADVRAGFGLDPPAQLKDANLRNWKDLAERWKNVAPGPMGELKKDDLEGVAGRRGAAMRDLAERVAAARMEAKRQINEVQFTDPTQRMRDLQTAALKTGGKNDVVDAIEKGNEERKENGKVLKEIKDLFDKGVAKFGEDGIILLGGP